MKRCLFFPGSKIWGFWILDFLLCFSCKCNFADPTQYFTCKNAHKLLWEVRNLAILSSRAALVLTQSLGTQLLIQLHLHASNGFE